MDRYMQMGIKDVIEQFPRVGEILERYGIGCVRCAVGTCKVADVVQIHALAPGDEARMMAEVAGVLDPGAVVEAPAAEPEQPAAPRPVAYSPPVRRLVEEHTWIKRLLAVIPAVIARIEATGAVDREQLATVLDFIRGFADRFHHLKEEDILFDYADRDAEVIQVMLQDHERARALVRAAAQALADDDQPALCAALAAYRDLLTEHITKEDEILYPFLDRGLTVAQVGDLFRRFDEAETAQGAGVSQRYHEFIAEIERDYTKEAEQCQSFAADVPDRA